MYVQRKTVARSDNRFGEGKQRCVLCFVELHVTANYIRIVTVVQQCLYGIYMAQAKNCELYVPFPNNLHHFHDSHTNAALKDMNACWLIANVAVLIVMAEMSLRGFSVFVCSAVKDFARSDGINQL
jgi:hypothetical protein